MRVFRGFGELPAFRFPAVTVGSYDGVHGGHRMLLQAAAEAARQLGGESVVVTFEPHPRIALGRAEGLRLLTTLDEKILLLDRFGVDNLVVIPFDLAFSRLPYATFVEEYLLGRIGMRQMIVGYNHRFGHNKEGDRSTLGALGRSSGFEVTEVAEQHVDAGRVSSTIIRRIIAEGDMARAVRLLTHPYLLLAGSDGRGAIRIDDPLKLLPPAGDYPVTAGGAAAVLTIDGRGNTTINRTLPAGRVPILFETC